MRNLSLVILCISFFIFQNQSLGQKIESETTELSWTQKGEAAFQAKDYKLCASCYDKASQLKPNDTKSRYAAARCYDLRKKKKKAYKRLQEATTLDLKHTTPQLFLNRSDFTNLSKKKKKWRKIEQQFQVSAMKVDKSMINRNMPQLYGTQLMEDGQLHPILDVQRVEKRRTSIGLSSLDDFTKSKDIKIPAAPIFSKTDFNRFLGGWDLVHIRDAETFQITYSPDQNYWIEFSNKGRLKYNLDVNTCSIPFKATDKGKLMLSKLASCTKACCDDRDLKKTLNYNDLVRFEIYNKVLFMMDDNRVLEFKKKRYPKQQVEGRN